MKNGVTLYFIRHGQTGWNAARRIQGQIDSDLSEKGRGQAAQNGRTLQSLGLDLDALDFVASPLKRTSETMEIVRENAGLQRTGYRTDDRLKEIHFGSWQGHYWPEVPDVDPAGHAARTADPFNWRPEGGESYADLTARCAAWFEQIEHDTVCVSHGGVSRVLRGHAGGGRHTPEEITELNVPQDRILVFRHTPEGIAADWIGG